MESPNPATDLTLQTAAERVARQFGRVFNAQMLWLESLDDLTPEGIAPEVEA